MEKNPDRLRIAVVGTPRSGNTWVRLVLGQALGLSELAVHNFLEVQEPIPDRCILQIHWYREPNFQAWLKRHEFRVVVPCRHPLDVLISMLQFIRWEPLTCRWLEGNAEIPPPLAGSSPACREFLDYALGWGSENLLCVSYQWLHDRQALQIKYEELCGMPEFSFSRLLSNFGLDYESSKKAVESIQFETLKKTPNHHGWQGKPGLWRQLIVSTDACLIYKRHQRIFDVLNYEVTSTSISRNSARKNWDRLTIR